MIETAILLSDDEYVVDGIDIGTMHRGEHFADGRNAYIERKTGAKNNTEVLQHPAAGLPDAAPLSQIHEYLSLYICTKRTFKGF